MKEVSINDLHPGMTVARDVYNPYNFHMVLQRGAVLNDTLIARMQLHGIFSIFVEEEEEPVQEETAPSTYSERMRKEPEFIAFKAAYEDNVNKFKDSFGGIARGETVSDQDLKDAMDVAMNIINTGQPKVRILDMLMNMREYDDSTFAHSMNVALLCNLLATWLGMESDQVEMATMCGLFHDLGKLKVPHEIITKPGSLTNMEYMEVQKHTLAGYEILKNMDVDPHVRNAALMHHERIDGSGYPLHLKGNQIDGFARMVSVADVYDAMTSARCYRGPLCPFQVIELFEKEGFEKYDVEFLLPFLESVANSYIQNQVRLSDGREGKLVYINKQTLSKPIVQVGNDYVNLAEKQDLKIDAIL